MADVKPSKVRTRALQEYELLRCTIERLDGLATRLAAEGEPAVDEALDVTARLIQELADYVDLEQLFVLPTVRRADIWGGLRAEALAREHERRRDELGAIVRAHGHPVEPHALAADLQAFARGLRDGLAREERDVLGSDLMRDDVVETEPD